MKESHISILIIDDDKSDRNLLRRNLKIHLNFECVEVDTVNEAMTLLDHKHFDCVIIDYKLPEKNGIEGIKLMKEAFPYMPTIMYTGEGNELIATEAMKVGAIDYIPKNVLNAEYLVRTIENALEKAEMQKKLDSQREELKMFTHVLTHDIRSPFASLKQLLKIVEENINSGSYEKLPETLKLINWTINYTDELIKSLFTYTKLESEIQFERVSLQDVMAIVVSNLQHILKEKNGIIKCEESLPEVIGNLSQLSQLFQNLITNGLKYNNSDSPTVCISTENREGEWLFKIKDNGIGIASDEYEKIFEPFKRLHGLDKYTGSGIGLTICRKIVERHKGKIWVESEEGKGSTFFVILPNVQT